MAKGMKFPFFGDRPSHPQSVGLRLKGTKGLRLAECCYLQSIVNPQTSKYLDNPLLRSATFLIPAGLGLDWIDLIDVLYRHHRLQGPACCQAVYMS